MGIITGGYVGVFGICASFGEKSLKRAGIGWVDWLNLLHSILPKVSQLTIHGRSYTVKEC
jgi:hypothetical protein